MAKKDGCPYGTKPHKMDHGGTECLVAGLIEFTDITGMKERIITWTDDAGFAPGLISEQIHSVSEKAKFPDDDFLESYNRKTGNIVFNISGGNVIPSGIGHTTIENGEIDIKFGAPAMDKIKKLQSEGIRPESIYCID